MAGVDLGTVQELMGHKALAMTLLRARVEVWTSISPVASGLSRAVAAWNRT